MMAAAVEETMWYVIVGGPFTAMALLVVWLVLSPAALRVGFEKTAAFVRRSVVFVGILFVCGAPGNAVFTLAMRDRYYYNADPVVDWLPWLPDPWFPLDTACGGHFLNGATAWTVLMAWVIVAAPVWGVSIIAFRHLQKSEWFRL